MTRRLASLIFCCLPALALAQGGVTTLSVTSSRSIGPFAAVYSWVTNTIGPATIAVGDVGACTVVGGPVPNCTVTAGNGTAANPFLCAAPVVLSNCSLPGQPFVVAAGDNNIDAHIHTLVVAAEPARPVPIAPWSAMAAALLIAAMTAIRLHGSTSPRA